MVYVFTMFTVTYIFFFFSNYFFFFIHKKAGLKKKWVFFWDIRQRTLKYAYSQVDNTKHRPTQHNISQGHFFMLRLLNSAHGDVYLYRDYTTKKEKVMLLKACFSRFQEPVLCYQLQINKYSFLIVWIILSKCYTNQIKQNL